MTTKQHAVVSMQLNIVKRPTYPEKFIRDNVLAPPLLLTVVIVTLPLSTEKLRSSEVPQRSSIMS